MQVPFTPYSPVNCEEIGNNFGCQLGVTVLDGSGQPDDTFGVSRIGQPGVSIEFVG